MGKKSAAGHDVQNININKLIQRFDPEEVITTGETWMWEKGIEPYDNPYGSASVWARIERTQDVERHIVNNSCYSGSGDLYVSMTYLRR